MVKFFPELDELKNLRVELTAGETYLLTVLRDSFITIKIPENK